VWNNKVSPLPGRLLPDSLAMPRWRRWRASKPMIAEDWLCERHKNYLNASRTSSTLVNLDCQIEYFLRNNGVLDVNWLRVVVAVENRENGHECVHDSFLFVVLTVLAPRTALTSQQMTQW
jgi:hypothetical protein